MLSFGFRSYNSPNGLSEPRELVNQLIERASNHKLPNLELAENCDV